MFWGCPPSFCKQNYGEMRDEETKLWGSEGMATKRRKRHKRLTG
jgi:hypothetical protein